MVFGVFPDDPVPSLEDYASNHYKPFIESLFSASTIVVSVKPWLLCALQVWASIFKPVWRCLADCLFVSRAKFVKSICLALRVQFKQYPNSQSRSKKWSLPFALRRKCFLDLSNNECAANGISILVAALAETITATAMGIGKGMIKGVRTGTGSQMSWPQIDVSIAHRFEI